MIINQIELQRANENEAAAAAEGEAPSGARGSIISLQLNLATYFQRDNATDTNGQAQE